MVHSGSQLPWIAQHASGSVSVKLRGPYAETCTQRPHPLQITHSPTHGRCCKVHRSGLAVDSSVAKRPELLGSFWEAISLQKMQSSRHLCRLQTIDKPQRALRGSTLLVVAQGFWKSLAGMTLRHRRTHDATHRKRSVPLKFSTCATIALNSAFPNEHVKSLVMGRVRCLPRSLLVFGTR